jgi:hypothetical protein
VSHGMPRGPLAEKRGERLDFRQLRHTSESA